MNSRLVAVRRDSSRYRRVATGIRSGTAPSFPLQLQLEHLVWKLVFEHQWRLSPGREAALPQPKPDDDQRAGNDETLAGTTECRADQPGCDDGEEQARRHSNQGAVSDETLARQVGARE